MRKHTIGEGGTGGVSAPVGLEDAMERRLEEDEPKKLEKILLNHM